MNARKFRVTSVGRFGWFFMALGLGVVTSCGGDDSNNVPAGAGGSTGTGSGGAGGGGAMLNGCDSATAVDKTASATTAVAFGNSLVYDPPCLRIKAGSSVTWSGDFVQHPLVGGTISGTTKTPDPASPIKLTMGADAGSVTFSFPNAGDFPYYCTIHGTFGMKGAVFVVP